MTNDTHSGGLILAAGGIVERWTDGGPQIAVIHRPRYQGEWNLPKGKLKEDESLSDAAIREVKEETGCAVKITGFAGVNHYQHAGKPKIVLFWKMKPEGECKFEPSEEVDALEWLTPKKARERLTHLEEKDLISEIYSGSKLAGRDVMTGSFAAQWSRLMYGLFGSLQRNRLANALDEFDARLKHRMKSLGANSEPAWLMATRQCQTRAKVALEELDYDSGWQSLHTAQSLEIWGYDEEEILIARQVLCKEASKLGGWRQEVVVKLVCSDSAQCPKDRRAEQRELYQATLVKNEQFNNLYHKIRVRGRSLKIVFFTLLAIVIGLPLLAKFDLLQRHEPTDWRMIVAIEVIGIFGAALSVASSLTKSTVDVSIPQQTLGSVVTWMRPVMGAAAAVAAYLLFQAGALPVIIRSGSQSLLASFVIAFLAGFSERFIIGAVGKILPGEK
ncbi:MAG: 8-oxo-dGTP diphosphatase [Blastocatellia bacterium]|jgi:8-oxo-dGTP diphosphatase|nr:8-oxo-dGTP diphosphatase [Blastocatellia bacterium]